ncbi:MAG: hypothetical protein GWN97_03240, partial [Thermoplasmata archaeon]|nr:hypothetical protein [Thermoplasmata archaeon]NIT75939.1 hypothetical protein [Thermoplasmata archaeon]NIY02310.1 hypothetical protein [Thermoplasmata archaeon]
MGPPINTSPGLIFSSLLGGDGTDYPRAIHRGNTGNLYIAGQTDSTDLPTTTEAINQTNQGGYDLFLTIMNPNATKLVYSTYIGGSSDDKLWDFQFDNDGNIILTGETSSTNFPVTIDAANTTLSGESDAFLLKLGPEGTSIRYSTFIGGVYPDVAYSVAVDGDNDCYVAGYTKSVDFPTTVGAFNRSLGGEYDGFVTKVNTSTGALEYSTYIGGEDETTSLFDFEHISDIAVSSKGAVFATGLTRSYDFPTTPNAFDTVSNRYAGTAFALKLSPDGGSLGYSTFLQSPRDGGSRGYSLVLVDDKYALVGGTTSLKDYPVTFGAYNGSDNSGSGKDDIFITKLDEDGRFLEFSGLIGGRDDERVHDIVVDDSSNIIITGFTKSDDQPLTECCYSDSLLGYDDAILIKFDPNLTSLLYSTY